MADHWQMRKLGEVAPARQASFPAADECVWHLSLEDIESETGKVLTQGTARVSELGPSKVAFDSRHVLYGKLRPYLNKVVVPDCPGVATSELLPLQPLSDVLDRHFLAFYLRSPQFVRFATANMQGANLPRVSLREFWAREIPVPPISEQRRIVTRIIEALTRLEEIDTLQRELYASTDASMASALAALFAEVESRYSSVAISDVTLESAYGTNQKCSVDGPGLPILRIPNIQPGEIDLSSLKYAELRPSELRKVILCPGDLLIVRTNGSPSLVGRCAVFEEESQFGYASYLIRFRLRRDLCVPAYLSFYLASTTGRDAIARIRRTSAGQFNINSENIRSIRFPLPPLDEQARLVESMAAISLTVRRLRAELDDHSVSASGLRSSILDKAFAGEL